MESSYSSDAKEEEVQHPIPLMDEENRIKVDYFRRFCSSLPSSYWGHPKDVAILKWWGKVHTTFQNYVFLHSTGLVLLEVV